MASIDELLDEMDDILSDAHGKAFSNRMTVDVEALKTVIEDIRLNVPEEIKQAKILASERREILNKANKEADAKIENAEIISRDLLVAAEARAKDMDMETTRRTEEVMRVAQQKSQELLANARAEADRLVSQQNVISEAQTKADQIRASAESYLDDAKAKAGRIIQDADYHAEQEMAAAKKWSHDLKVNASKYVDEIVNEADYRIGRSFNEIQQLKEKLDVAASGAKGSDKKASKDKPQSSRDISSSSYGMTEKRAQNKARNAENAYGNRRVEEPSVEPEPEIIRHQSVIDIPLSDDFVAAFDDPPLHDRPGYNIEL